MQQNQTNNNDFAQLHHQAMDQQQQHLDFSEDGSSVTGDNDGMLILTASDAQLDADGSTLILLHLQQQQQQQQENGSQMQMEEQQLVLEQQMQLQQQQSVVFGSQLVDKNSITPYSDATQVSESDIYYGLVDLICDN